MKYLLNLFFTCVSSVVFAQPLKFTDGEINKIPAFRGERPIVIKSDATSTIVACFEYGKTDNIWFMETPADGSQATQIKKYNVGVGVNYLLWAIVDNKLLFVFADDTEGDYYSENKKTYIMLLDKKGKEIAKREMGDYKHYNFSIVISPDKKKLLYTSRAAQSFINEEESDEELDYIVYRRMNTSTLEDETEFEITVDKNHREADVLLSNSEMVYHCFSSGTGEARNYYYDRIDITRDSLDSEIPVFEKKDGKVLNCSPFLAGNNVGFAGLAKNKKGGYFLYSTVFNNDSLKPVKSRYTFSEDEVAELEPELSGNSRIITSVTSLLLQEAHSTKKGTFLFFECYEYERPVRFYNDLYVMELDEKYTLSKCFSIPKRIRSNSSPAGFGFHVSEDSIRIFYEELPQKKKSAIPPYFDASVASRSAIAVISFSISKPSDFNKQLYTPKFFKKGFLLDLRYMPRVVDTPIKLLALTESAYQVVSIDW